MYNEAYFQHDEVLALAQRFTGLLEQGLDNTELPVGAFSMVTAAEQARLHQWNATAQPIAQPRTLPRARRRPRPCARRTQWPRSTRAVS